MRFECMSMTNIFNQGYGLIKKGDFERAKQVFRLGVERFPRRTEFKEGLAFIAINEKNFLQAQNIYKDLITENPEFPIVNLNRVTENLYCNGSLQDIKKFIDHDTDWQHDTIVFGCSHAYATFIKPNLDYKIPLIFSRPGSTIAGFGKRKSALNTFSKIQETVKSINPSTIVLKFGQVDVDLGFYYRLFVKGEEIKNPQEFFDKIIEDYVDKISLIEVPEKFVCGINMPTIIDKSMAIKYTSKVIAETPAGESRKELSFMDVQQKFPSYETRFKISLTFNEILRQKCAERGLPYFDFTEEFCTSGTVTDDIRPSDDHHYSLHEKHSHIVWEKTFQIFKSTGD